jgi:hypothetical protein
MGRRLVAIFGAVLLWAGITMSIESWLGWSGKPQHLFVDIGVALLMIAAGAIGRGIILARKPTATLKNPFS